jgi:hypothetical protein
LGGNEEARTISEGNRPGASRQVSCVCYAGGGFVWDALLEYRVWCQPERGAPDEEDGNDYYYAFVSHPDARRFYRKTTGAEEPLALILQKEYIVETTPGQFAHVKKRRVTEWPVRFSLTSAPHKEHHSRFSVAQCTRKSTRDFTWTGKKASLASKACSGLEPNFVVELKRRKLAKRRDSRVYSISRAARDLSC